MGARHCFVPAIYDDTHVLLPIVSDPKTGIAENEHELSLEYQFSKVMFVSSKKSQEEHSESLGSSDGRKRDNRDSTYRCETHAQARRTLPLPTSNPGPVSMDS